MTVKHRHRYLQLCFSLAFLLTSQYALALGLGQARVESYLGQPLDIRVELISRSEAELATVTASMASAADHRVMGLPAPLVGLPLEFTVIRDLSNPHIRVTSRQPIREPVMQLVVEVVWAGGRMLKQYTLFFDPPTFPSAAPLPDSRTRPDPPAVSSVPSPPADNAITIQAAPQPQTRNQPMQERESSPFAGPAPQPVPERASTQNEPEAESSVDSRPLLQSSNPGPVSATVDTGPPFNPSAVPQQPPMSQQEIDPSVQSLDSLAGEATEQAPMEQMSSEQAAVQQVVVEQAPAEQEPTEQTLVEQASAEQEVIEQAPVEKAPLEQSTVPSAAVAATEPEPVLSVPPELEPSFPDEEPASAADGLEEHESTDAPLPTETEAPDLQMASSENRETDSQLATGASAQSQAPELETDELPPAPGVKTAEHNETVATISEGPENQQDESTTTAGDQEADPAVEEPGPTAAVVMDETDDESGQAQVPPSPEPAMPATEVSDEVQRLAELEEEGAREEPLVVAPAESLPEDSPPLEIDASQGSGDMAEEQLAEAEIETVPETGDETPVPAETSAGQALVARAESEPEEDAIALAEEVAREDDMPASNTAGEEVTDTGPVEAVEAESAIAEAINTEATLPEPGETGPLNPQPEDTAEQPVETDDGSVEQIAVNRKPEEFDQEPTAQLAAQEQVPGPVVPESIQEAPSGSEPAAGNEDLPPVDVVFRAVAAPAPASAIVPAQHSVAKGETLWSLSREWAKAQGVEVNQMMLAVQRQNPDAFIDGNINRMMAGSVLRLPPEQMAQQLSAREAMLEVLRQEQMLYAGSGGPKSADRLPSLADGAQQGNGRSATPNAMAAAPERSRLELVPPSDSADQDIQEFGQGNSGDVGVAVGESLVEELARTQEELVNARQENQYLTERIDELEGELGRLRNDVDGTVADTNLAELEQRLREERQSGNREVSGEPLLGPENERAWYARLGPWVAGLLILLVAWMVTMLRARSVRGESASSRSDSLTD